jgi:vanillate O-demethylase monooxygenase subunit
LEDETMLNAQQAAIDADPDYEVYNLNIDAGGMWARRAISALIDAELALDPASGRSHTTEPAPA